MIFFHSGDGSSYSQPEIMLGDKATLMLTFYGQHKKLKPNRRFKNILQARKRRKKRDHS